MAKIVCSVCGSDDVQAKVWVRLNENFETTTDFIDEMIREPAECWCCRCEENQKLIIVSEEEVLPNTTAETLRCEECGSAKVQIQAWVDPNNGNTFISDQEDYSHSWCDGCGQNVLAIPHRELMENIELWWKQLDNGEDREVITGLVTEDYAPENNYQEFETACNEIWIAKPEEERIEIWKQLIKSGSDDNE